MKTYKTLSDLKSAIKAINPVFFEKKALKWLNIAEFKKIGNSGAFYQGAEAGTWARNTLKYFDGVTIHSTEIKDYNEAKNIIKILNKAIEKSNILKINLLLDLINVKNIDFCIFTAVYIGLNIKSKTRDNLNNELLELLVIEECKALEQTISQASKEIKKTKSL